MLIREVQDESSAPDSALCQKFEGLKINSGIGRIGIIEGDNVEIHNLHRQIAYSESSIGKSKADEIKTAINR